MNPLASLVNGREQRVMNVTSRLQYGDGLFETVAIHDGRLLLWSEHVQRLMAGVERLGLDGIDATRLASEAETLAGGRRLAILKIIVVRGAVGRAYRPLAAPTDRILTVWPWSDRPVDEQAPVFWCRTTLARQPLLAGLKHLNRLEQVLAQREFTEPYWEGLMQDTQGWVIEGTMSNLFVVEDGILATPVLDQAGVAGVMRNQVMRRARESGMVVRSDHFTSARVMEADEVFLSNSVIGVRPVLRLGKRWWRHGPVTRLIAETLRVRGDAPVL